MYIEAFRQILMDCAEQFFDGFIQSQQAQRQLTQNKMEFLSDIHHNFVEYMKAWGFKNIDEIKQLVSNYDKELSEFSSNSQI